MLSTPQRTTTVVASALTPATKLVLLHMLSIGEHKTFSVTSSTAKIAAACALTDRGVRKSLHMLADAKLVQDITTTNRGDRTWLLNLLMLDTLPAAGASA